MLIATLVKKLFNYLRPDMSPDEVKEKFTKLAADDPEKLNWQTSSVDLLKLLDLDSSLEGRKELADELGHEGEFTGTAEQNIWLHKAVLDEIAVRGIKLPPSA